MPCLALLFLPLLIQGQDLASVKAEPVLEKRAQKAIDLANTTLSHARSQYEKGDFKSLAPAMEEVTAAAELNIASLEAMGKHPSKNVKNYKLSEKRMRELARRLETFANDVSFQDRDIVTKAQKRVTEIHEKLLEGALSKKP